MADGLVQVPPDSTGKKIDTSEITVGANTVERQRMVVADPATATALAVVQSANPGNSDFGLTVRSVGTVAQGTSLGSTPVGLNGGSVTTNAPAYTTGQISPLSLTTNGALRVEETSTAVLQNNATVIATGSQVVSGLGEKEINLIVNIKAAPTGTTPTITYSITDIDPVDLATAIGQTITGATLNSAITQVLTHNSRSGAVKITWTVTGTTPSFTQVFSALQPKAGVAASPSTATLTNVAAASSSTSMLSANSERKSGAIFNDSVTSMYIHMGGGTASTSAFSTKVPPGGYFEFPQPCVTGAITAIWDATASGNARITEYT